MCPFSATRPVHSSCFMNEPSSNLVEYLLPRVPQHHDGSQPRRQEDGVLDGVDVVVALTFSTGRYDPFIPFLLVHVLVVRVVFIDLPLLWLVPADMISVQYEINIVSTVVMIMYGLN